MILFDLDGTLIDSTGVWSQVDYQFLANHGLEMSDEYMTNITRSTFPVAARYTKEYYNLNMSPEEIIEEWTSLVKDAYDHHISLKPGAREYLEFLSRSEQPMVIVTSCGPELGRAVLDRHNITSLFQHIFFAQDLGFEKRDPQFFLYVLEKLNVSPQECTLYEDSPENCSVAKNLGINVIGILDHSYSYDHPRLLDICNYCIHDFTELL